MILHKSKMKDFADDKMNVTQKLNFVLGRVENIVGKGENAGNQHFLLFPQCFLPFRKEISKFQSCLFCRLHMVSICVSL